jgi:hypothetical protein
MSNLDLQADLFHLVEHAVEIALHHVGHVPFFAPPFQARKEDSWEALLHKIKI